MQYLKEEVRLEIMKAALEEFKQNGFEKTSMKNISSNAGVAIGNIYRYFKNKQELFNAIVEPVQSYITTVIFNKFLPASSDSSVRFNLIDLVDSIMNVDLSYSSELMIMVYKSKGTNYENTKGYLIDLVYERLTLEYLHIFEKQRIDNCEQFLHVFATVLIDGMFTVLKSTENVNEKRKLLNQLLLFYFNKLDERFI
ncbi:TetR/AcrR family transcriptional regulator [Clostridium sp. YIM B02505]|uniref:TetR/AcrR family transcriptional regulator n=1 Tax=Clostridium yunnanense TaxID=2800325 RepID=A0ABS1EKU8_9CLOT|nr:TetR/AcrR family transcriptional regulator [Clostridium yunnanense]MBK1809979.1 TetR/AcrR family transcriptional regulator [Clostridium yunnanense]